MGGAIAKLVAWLRYGYCHLIDKVLRGQPVSVTCSQVHTWRDGKEIVVVRNWIVVQPIKGGVLRRNSVLQKTMSQHKSHTYDPSFCLKSVNAVRKFDLKVFIATEGQDVVLVRLRPPHIWYVFPPARIQSNTSMEEFNLPAGRYLQM